MDNLHQDVLISNMKKLVNEINVNLLFPELLSRGILSPEATDRILTTSDFTGQKIALFYELLNGGPKTFAQFLKALESTSQIELAQYLRDDEMERRCLADGAVLENSSHSNFPLLEVSVSSNDRNGAEELHLSSHTILGSNNTGSQESTVNIDTPDGVKCESQDLNPQNKVFQSPAYQASPIAEYPSLRKLMSLKFHPVDVKLASEFKEDDIPKYKMDSNPRGFALIINNIDFDDSEEYRTRHGADNDEYRLKELWEKLHFEVEVHRNKSASEILKVTKAFSERQELNECDCAIITIMSHGEEGDCEENSNIIGTDGIGVPIYKIVDYFHHDACRPLINKPKVFFFQGCRGVLYDPGVIALSTTSIKIHTDGKTVFEVEMKKPDGIRSRSDVFIAYPVPPGRTANRDPVVGSWFIQSIIEVFSEHAWNNHLDDLMKMVDSKINELCNSYVKMQRTHNFIFDQFQTVNISLLGWNKHLYFNPGVAKDKLTGEVYRIGGGEKKTSVNEDKNDFGNDECRRGNSLYNVETTEKENGCTQTGCINTSQCHLI